MREPLLHFVVLGAVLFGVDHVLVGRDRRSAHHRRRRARSTGGHRGIQGRTRPQPNAEELYALRQVWLDNEVLYREGLALGLDKGDKAIRERVIFKALSIVDAGTKLPPLR